MDKVFFLVMMAIIVIIIFGVGYINSRRQWEYIQSKIKASFGKPSAREYGDGEYRHIAGYNNNHKTEYTVDDITWNDLDMDSIFMDMNYSQSSAGEEYLYYMLRNPSLAGDKKEEFEKKCKYYTENEEKRNQLLLALYKCGRTGKYSIYDYLNNLDTIADKNFNKDIWLLLLYAATLFILPFSLGIFVVIMGGLLLYGGVTYFSTKKSIEPYITSFAYVFRIINGASLICSVNDPVIADEQARLKELKKKMTSFARFSYLIMSPNSGTGNILEVILDYIRIFFHVDIIKFFQMRNEITKHWDDIDEMLTIMGSIDAMLSIASYREYLQNWCRPEFEKKGIVSKGLYHPLLSNPVTNDINLERGIILTGSNASGKSTMLKTIAVAAIMGQAINTVPASYYSAPAFRVYTSLALNDDIFAGESYYMTEIKSLKRILDNSKTSSNPILACVDEVLRGTNTIERISASNVILTELSTVNGIIITATHDRELASMLSDRYDNFHFEETISGNDISFAYKMEPGIAVTRNAIRLLEIVGYDKGITEKADELAKRYENTGSFV